MQTKALTTLLLFAMLCSTSLQSAMACPFCAAVSQTFTEEIESMDVVVIAKLVELPKQPKDPALGGVKAKFEIVTTIKGKEHLGKNKFIESLYYGEGRLDRQFLLMATDPPQLMWSTPTLLSIRAIDYIHKALKQPKQGAERLAFFQQFLEDKDEMLARDAYDEFAKAPYDSVVALKPKMNHDQLVTWIENPELPANRRRLYLTMLGVCGDNSDLEFLEGFLRSTDRKSKAGLDALIGCYLTLARSDGMTLIEELFLKNKEAEYADTYAAIMAIRFHGTETDVIPRKRLLAGLHHMLDRPSLADLIIVDLARWEDWSVADKLVDLFKNADEDSSWVRVPVIRYLMACPKPEAKKYLIELEKVDPDAMKRAQTFFPFRNSGVPSRAEAEKIAASENLLINDDVAFAAEEEIALVGVDLPLEGEVVEDGTAVAQRSTRDHHSTAGDVSLAESVKNQAPIPQPKMTYTLGIPVGLGVLLMLAVWGVLYTPTSSSIV
ncbi:MAG: hypothetical protein ACKVH8_17145 [Pirellulales bacterium]|jgi:hypothetical protein